MKQLWAAILAELLKCRGATVSWMTFVAFALGPLMGGFFMYVLSGNLVDEASLLSAKASAMAFTSTWPSYLMMLSQVVGVGGVLVFGFVASWIFGREYSDRTAKDLLALPTSRATIINAKFVTYMLWSTALACSNLVVGFVIGKMLALPDAPDLILLTSLRKYFITTILAILLGPPVSLAALWGRGYLAPLSILALMIVVSQIVAATGWGAHFPWSVPGLYSGIADLDIGRPDTLSYLIVICTAITGYFGCVLFWRKADHS